MPVLDPEGRVIGRSNEVALVHFNTLFLELLMQALGLSKQTVVFHNKSAILVDISSPFWDGHDLDVVIRGLDWCILYNQNSPSGPLPGQTISLT